MSSAALSAPSAEHPAKTPARRLEGLDLLRGIAALCVLHFHVFSIQFPQLAMDGKGYLAVDFFFMLSGYVMSRTYEHKFAAGYGARRFMVARYRRLWPVMAIGMAIGAPMVALEMHDPAHFLKVAAANFLLIPAVAGSVIFPLNAAAWSIFAELVANLVHGLLLWRCRTRWLVLFWTFMLAALTLVGRNHGNLDAGASAGLAWAGVARALLSYTAGIVLWRWWHDSPSIRIKPAAAFLTMPVLLVLSQFAGTQGWLADLGFIALVCPMMIAGGLAWNGEHYAARWLGAISFPLYAVNLQLMHFVKGLGLGAFIGVAGSLILASYIAWRTDPRQRTGGKLAQA